MSLRVIWILTRFPAGTGGSVASVAGCAFASASALGAVIPAKLWSGRLWEVALALDVIACAEWS
jgi:hypothetical protein